MWAHIISSGGNLQHVCRKIETFCFAYFFNRRRYIMQNSSMFRVRYTGERLLDLLCRVLIFRYILSLYVGYGPNLPKNRSTNCVLRYRISLCTNARPMRLPHNWSLDPLPERCNTVYFTGSFSWLAEASLPRTQRSNGYSQRRSASWFISVISINCHKMHRILLTRLSCPKRRDL